VKREKEDVEGDSTIPSRLLERNTVDIGIDHVEIEIQTGFQEACHEGEDDGDIEEAS
jgi:hypothetical protein